VSASPDFEQAINAISDPERLRSAQALVAQAAPQLERVLAAALREGGWFDSAHNAAVREAVSSSDPVAAVKALCLEETRLSMLVGVAVGLELARELAN
jgi:hypothetical protein